MNLMWLQVKIARAQLGILFLVMLLQRSPAVRVLSVLERGLSQPISRIVQATTWVATCMGVFHATAGATTFQTTPGRSPFSGTVGEEFSSFVFTVTDAPVNPARWVIAGTIAPGIELLSNTNKTLVDGEIFGSTITVQGTPTTEGIFVFSAQAFNAVGDTDNNQYEIQINVSASTLPPGPPVIRNARWGGSGMVGDLQLSAGITYRIDFSTNAKDWSPLMVEFVANQPTQTFTPNSNQILSDISLGNQLGFYALVEESP